jgi:acetylornithine/N-succinyldiaminopimelate aminotransferase
MVKALTEQAHTLWHVSNWMTNEPALRLAKSWSTRPLPNACSVQLRRRSQRSALKLARAVSAHDHCGPEKFRGSPRLTPSGRTLFTVSAGGTAKYSTGFGPPPTGFTHIRYNDIAGSRGRVRGGKAATTSAR